MRRWVLVTVLAAVLVGRSFATVLPLVPPVTPPTILWDVLVVVAGAIVGEWYWEDVFGLDFTEQYYEYLESALVDDYVDSELEDWIDAQLLPVPASPEDIPAEPAPGQGPGWVAPTIGVASVVGWLTYNGLRGSGVGQNGDVVYGKSFDQSNSSLITSPGEWWVGEEVSIGSTTLTAMPADVNDALAYALTTGNKPASWSGPGLENLLRHHGEFDTDGWEGDWYSGSSTAGYWGLAEQWRQVAGTAAVGVRHWNATDYAGSGFDHEFGELWEVWGNAVRQIGSGTAAGGLYGRTWLWPEGYRVVPAWSSPTVDMYVPESASRLFTHGTYLESNVEFGNAYAGVVTEVWEVVRADTDFGTPNTAVGYLHDDAFQGAVTGVVSVGYIVWSYVWVDGAFLGEDSEYGSYEWAALLPVGSLWGAVEIHSALTAWARGAVAPPQVSYPNVEIEVGGIGVALPWDIAGAADFGTATQTGTGADVWWIVNPVAALEAAFVPQVGLGRRIGDMIETLRGKFPFALATALGFSASVGSGPLEVASIEYAGVSIAADNVWLNQIGGVTRTAATLLLLVLLVVWLRGKMMPRAVV